jgi:hypothetical protein
MQTLDEKLVSAGFVKTSILTIRDEKGTDIVPYVRAYTRLGDTCYIEFEGGAVADAVRIVPSAADTRMRATVRTGSIIPHQTKISVSQCASSSVCGVAFECNNEVCVLQPESCTDRPRETIYVVAESIPTKHVQAAGSPLAYPVVRYSEIEACAETAIANVHRAAAAIAARAISVVSNNMAELSRRATSAAITLQTLSARWAELHASRCRETEELSALLEWHRRCTAAAAAGAGAGACVSDAPVGALEKEKAIVADLCRRGRALERYLHLQNRLLSIMPEVSRLEAITANAFSDAYLCSRTVEPCACRQSPELWGFHASLAQYDEELAAGRWPEALNTWIHNYRSTHHECAQRLEQLKIAIEQP